MNTDLIWILLIGGTAITIGAIEYPVYRSKGVVEYHRWARPNCEFELRDPSLANWDAAGYAPISAWSSLCFLYVATWAADKDDIALAIIMSLVSVGSFFLHYNDTTRSKDYIGVTMALWYLATYHPLNHIAPKWRYTNHITVIVMLVVLSIHSGSAHETTFAGMKTDAEVMHALGLGAVGITYAIVAGPKSWISAYIFAATTVALVLAKLLGGDYRDKAACNNNVDHERTHDLLHGLWHILASLLIVCGLGPVYHKQQPLTHFVKSIAAAFISAIVCMLIADPSPPTGSLFSMWIAILAAAIVSVVCAATIPDTNNSYNQLENQ
jgi:hypothetical protein